jgi:hypothetical protein
VAAGNPNVIHILFPIEGGRVRDIPACDVGDDGDIVADFILVRITDARIKRFADGDVGRPAVAAIEAVGIEELRGDVVRGVPGIEPDRIESSIRSDGESAKPVKFILAGRIVVDSSRSAVSLTAIGAGDKHQVRSARAPNLRTLAAM